jgi:BirA family transcriptional regulator, biotin operon repressor / biotin---[acetyl-CoA-carboxylase] ligase
MLGHPRLHLHRTDSTNERARALASAGAPHGALVTAGEQTAGRGRQGRVWSAPPRSSLLMSLVLRDQPALLPLVAAVAVCDIAGEGAAVKWPNDVVRRSTLGKLAGVLIEARPQEDWAVVGIGVNVALQVEDLPPELHPTAASLELPPSEIEPLLGELLQAFERRLAQPPETLLDAWRTLDVLYGQRVSWEQNPTAMESGRQMVGCAEGVDGEGRLIVLLDSGAQATLSAGEVHLQPPPV